MPAVAPVYNTSILVVPSDTINQFGPQGLLSDALYVGGAGIVVAVFENGVTSNFTAVAGEILPIRIKRVNATTTTATLMNLLYTAP